jgi:hypothetical protein
VEAELPGELHLFSGFLLRSRGSVPWAQSSNHTAVLLEFRPLRREVRFSIANVRDALPVYWRIQVRLLSCRCILDGLGE